MSGQQPAIVTMDAKQRNVLMVHDPARAGNWRVCAEASPDVFSALSTSAGADLGFGQSGAQTEAQARAAIAIAEAAGTIERTQTINMLRESMYRTCERYMSGAIDRATFVVQAGRDWRAMIAILAIEQLTRTARPASTIIAAGSTSATVEGAGDATRQLIAAQGRLEAARRREREAQDAPPECPLPTDPEPSDEDEAACEAEATKVARARADQEQATADIATWRAVLASGATERTAAATGAGESDPGGQDAQPASATGQVALVVGEIVRRAFDTDETQLFCLQILTPQSGLVVNDRLKDRCTDYLLAVVETEGARLLERSDLRHRGFQESLDVSSARREMLSYLRSLSPAAFPAEAEAIRGTIPTFCRRATTLGECIQDIEDGILDNISSDLVVQAIRQRTQQGGQW